MTAVAADEGIAFRFDVARPGNTFDAHRLAHLAAMQGVQHQLQERLLAATFSEGQAVGDHDVLVGLATDVGIDADEVARMLASDDYAEAVRTDEQVAVDLGITAVPFFVVDRATGSVAPNPAEALCALLQRGRADIHEPSLATGRSVAPGRNGDACDIGPA